MTTPENQQTAQVPAVGGGGFPPGPDAPGGGGGGGFDPNPNSVPNMATVTRNSPPKRVVVNAGQEVVVGNQRYGPGDTLLLMGPEADALMSRGMVVITSHEEVAAWNGKEGRDHAKRVLADVDANHAMLAAKPALDAYLRGDIGADEFHAQVEQAKNEAADARDHDHGFGRYEHADEQGIEADYTMNRQRLGVAHAYDPTKPNEMTNEQAGVKDPGAKGA